MLRHIIPIFPEVDNVRQPGKVVCHNVGLAGQVSHLELVRLKREVPVSELWSFIEFIQVSAQ